MKTMMTMGVIGMILAGAGAAAAQDYGYGSQYGWSQGCDGHRVPDRGWVPSPRQPEYLGPPIRVNPREGCEGTWSFEFRIEWEGGCFNTPVQPPARHRRPDMRHFGR